MSLRPLRNLTAAALIAVLGCHVAACGTILYPERKGQTGGRIDPGVAILNGVGLLFFLVPGVIAFAVDFATGTIYLPGTASLDDGAPEGWQTAGRIDGPVTPERLETALAALAALAGAPVDLTRAQTLDAPLAERRLALARASGGQ